MSDIAHEGLIYRAFLLALSAMVSLHNPTIRLIGMDDPPRCPLPALLGPAKQAACFSICDERLEVDSTTALRYFSPPALGANLREGLEQFLDLPLEDRTFQYARRLDNVFTACLDSENSEELLKAEVVTWRGIMTKIMLGDTLDLNASYYNGVLYLEENPGPVRFDADSRCTFVGYTHLFERLHPFALTGEHRHKFESICTVAAGGERCDGDVDMHTLWNTAIIRTLGSLKILLVGEVDCVQPGYAENPSPENYVELKTKKQKKVHNIAHKKWTMQSCLLGTQVIVLGLLDGNDVVQELVVYPVEPKTIHQCIFDWGARVIHALRDHCMRSGSQENGNLKVWRVMLRKRHIDICELDATQVNKLNHGGVPRNGIIPVSFIRGLERRADAA
ncbi:hypothetical protein B0H15DRAFT_542023 [Mycena belliarum]|uniref:Decapping nuclease n=1 Tax=Mycena belliarum TaxID=1033014 RepID=A0AAD6UF80_9AGAR|nr:hypothetical protein B0H15DRAFT_542023 [Mycena belliae]